MEVALNIQSYHPLVLLYMGVCKEESRGLTYSGGDDKPNGAQVKKHRSLHCGKLKDEADVEKQNMSVEAKNMH